MTEVRSADFHRLFKETRDFDKKLYTALRKNLRAAGDPIVSDIKGTIDQIPSGGVSKSRATQKLRSGKRVVTTEGGIRTRLKAGTKVGILASSAKTAGIRITTSPSKLPPGKRALAKAMNKSSFRHPVFPDSDGAIAWVSQPGRPYFGSVVLSHQEQVKRAAQEAFFDAARQLPNYHD